MRICLFAHCIICMDHVPSYRRSYIIRISFMNYSGFELDLLFKMLDGEMVWRHVLQVNVPNLICVNGLWYEQLYQHYFLIIIIVFSLLLLLIVCGVGLHDLSFESLFCIFHFQVDIPKLQNGTIDNHILCMQFAFK